MKSLKIFLGTVCAIVLSYPVLAQTTIYDANRLLGTDLNGTARYIGMGGAMGALGGDITTMSTNPAGIGIYRSNDVMVSFGFANNGMKTEYPGQTNELNDFFGSFDNAGFVFAYKIGNQTPLRYVNFGFNYRRTKSFNRNSFMGGTYLSSQTQQMADMTNASNVGVSALEANNAYFDSNVPWLGILGYDSYLVNPWYKDGKLGGFDPYYMQGDETDAVYRARERGGLNEFDFNLAFNLYDRVYFGATVGVYYLDYTRNSNYSEDYFYQDNGEWMTAGGYTLNNYYHSSGTGVDVKLGMIVRPFENSPLRIGAAVHTPTFYRITEYTSASIDFDVDVLNENDVYVQQTGNTYTQDSYGNDMRSETVNKIVTPWRYNLSLGYTIGSAVALGVEYEYADYSRTKLKYDDGITMSVETEDARNMLKGVSTIKAGAEFKIVPEFAFRVGYNHITSAMIDDAFKYLPSNSVRTDTEYSNLKSANNYTFGIGYRGESFYADLAYQFNTYKEHFYAFDNIDLTRTKVINKNSKVVCTIGMRF